VTGKLFQRILWAAAAAALLTGISMTVHSVSTLNETSGRMRNKVRSLGKMRRMESELASYQAAFDAYEALPDKRPTPLSTTLENTLPPDITREIREAERLGVAGGWTMRRYEISMNRAPISEVVAFVAAAEAGRPPWRLSKCDVRVDPQSPGSGRVVLKMEALEK